MLCCFHTECSLTCANDGTLDTDTCQCTCGERWTGDDCSGRALTGSDMVGVGWDGFGQIWMGFGGVGLG